MATRALDSGAFYASDGATYDPSELTRGPWDPGSQHAGPPCALLAGELDRAGEIRQARVARITFEILRPVPIAPLRMSAGVVRPGRSVELVEGVLSQDDTEILRARAWRIRMEAVEVDGPQPDEQPMPGPDAAEPRDFFPTGHDLGYHSAMEARFLAGSYVEPGPARAWMRQRVPLVEGCETSPLERLLVAADSGNGVSAPLDYDRFVFINTDLSVALRRLPRGDWIGLDSISHAEPDGIGLTDTALHDGHGPLGRVTQSLLIARRSTGPPRGPGRTPPGGAPRR
ncbi:MAG: thioesterase family protein [Actinomycetota bacterium]|nr:thioesterase family protein [Actinomycetota bacterium]